LTALVTGAKLSPRESFVVRGSDVNMCARTHELINADKRSMRVNYDRCSPSLLAFGQRSEAMRFAREHGGVVVPFTAIVDAFAH
jgi:hypothetical protein